ncbi:MAG: ribonuclease E/G [Paracoccaceae bacterium]
MKGRVAVIDEVAPGQPAAALLDDRQLVDFLADPPAGDLTPRAGEIFCARLERPLKGLGGAIVDLGNGWSGYLRQTTGQRPGERILVQVSACAEPGKAPPVTTRLTFKSRFAILTPGAPGINVARRIRDEAERDRLLRIAHEGLGGQADGAGLILRSACAGAPGADISADIAALREVCKGVLAEQGRRTTGLVLAAPDAATRAWRDWTDPVPDAVIEEAGAFERMDICGHIGSLMRPRADLPGGAWMEIEPTRALVAVDVNTGADFSPSAALKANIAAARDLPRQLLLRGLGGQVVVDFAPLPKRDRRQVQQALSAALRKDPVDTQVAGWTGLGHLELQRKRERRPLMEIVKP